MAILRAGKFRKTDCWTLRVDVGNCDARMLKRFQELFGGNVVRKEIAKAHHMQQWRWYVNGAKAANVLKQILPYMVCKREQAETALLSRSFLRGKHEGHLSDRLDKMRECAMRLKALKRGLPSWESVNVIN